MNFKKIKKMFKEKLSEMDKGEIFDNRKQILEDFVVEMIEEGLAPDDFSCAYFEVHELNKIMRSYY